MMWPPKANQFFLSRYKYISWGSKFVCECFVNDPKQLSAAVCCNNDVSNVGRELRITWFGHCPNRQAMLHDAISEPPLLATVLLDECLAVLYGAFLFEV